MVKRIVIVGGGRGGLNVARGLRFVDAQVTLVDRRDSHLVQSKLYAAAVSDCSVQIPFSRLLREHGNVQVVRGEAVYLDARRRRLILAERALPYDTLVIATGSRPRYDRAEWRGVAPSVRSTEDVRERLRDPGATAVIIGGGVAGVELASVVARANRARRVVLVESGHRLLADFPERLAREAQRQLEKVGVEIRLGTHAIGMDKESVRLSGALGRERIPSRAVLWAGGVQGSELGEVLRSETGVALDESGRVCVEPDLSIAKHPEMFVIGDLARVLHDDVALPGLATVAAQQGRYVAFAIRERVAGYGVRPFQYVDQGRFVILGRGGIGVIGECRLQGTAAWFASMVARKWSATGEFLPNWRLYSAATGS